MAGPAATSVVKGYNLALNTATTSSSTDQAAATITSSVHTSSTNQYSAGALAGVGVGVGIPLLIALLAVLFLLKKERKKNKQLRQTAFIQKSPEDHAAFDHKGELPAATQSPRGKEDNGYVHLPQHAKYEVDASQRSRTELPS